MRFPWANIALIALFTAELVTGYLGLTHSNAEWIGAMHLHRIFGFAILALFAWKSRNILGSMRTKSNWRGSLRTMLWSITLLAGLLIVIGLGLAWSHLGAYAWMGFSGTTIHMNLAWMLIPLLLWHSFRHRISLRIRYLVDRRHVLRVVGLALAGFLAWRTAELAGVLATGPGAQRRFTGSYPETGSDFPVTMWLNDKVPGIDGSTWNLSVDGHVESPYRIELADLQAWNDKLTATLDCTGGWQTTREWEGVPIGRLLARAPGSNPARAALRSGHGRDTSAGTLSKKPTGRCWPAGWTANRFPPGTASPREW